MTANTTINSTALIQSWLEFKRFEGRVNDSELEVYSALINQASAMIEKYCGRCFAARHFGPEYHRGGSLLNLKNYPLLSFPDITSGYISMESQTGSATEDGSTTSLTDSARTEDDDYWNGAEIFISTTAGAAPERSQVLDFASGVYTLKTEYALQASVASGDTYEVVRYNTTGAYTLQNTDIMEINYDAGIVRLAAHYGELCFSYWAGYKVIPDQLKLACALQAKYLNTLYKNQGLSSASMGDKSVTRNIVDLLSLSPEVMGILKPFKDRSKFI